MSASLDKAVRWMSASLDKAARWISASLDKVARWMSASLDKAARWMSASLDKAAGPRLTKAGGERWTILQPRKKDAYAMVGHQEGKGRRSKASGTTE